MTAHPHWYYKLYESVFAPSRNYRREIAQIHDVEPLAGREVEELGAGTGNHIAELVRWSPRAVIAVDADLTAIDILRQRFSSEPRVRVIHADAFDRRGSADLIVCFTSILQQADRATLVQRLHHLASRMTASPSAAVFEIIDTNRHLSANRSGERTHILENAQNEIWVETTSELDYMTIRYSGFVDGDSIGYEVRLCHMDEDTILRLCREVGMRATAHPLSESRRRLLIHARPHDGLSMDARQRVAK